MTPWPPPPAPASLLRICCRARQRRCGCCCRSGRISARRRSTPTGGTSSSPRGTRSRCSSGDTEHPLPPLAVTAVPRWPGWALHCTRMHGAQQVPPRHPRSVTRFPGVPRCASPRLLEWRRRPASAGPPPVGPGLHGRVGIGMGGGDQARRRRESSSSRVRGGTVWHSVNLPVSGNLNFALAVSTQNLTFFILKHLFLISWSLSWLL